MIKVIKNGNVITMSNKYNKIEKLDIVIKDDKIFDIVENYTGEYDYVIDASNMVVLPGLVNAHAHLGMSLFRATNDNLTLNDWLNNYIWPIEDKLTDEDVYYATLFTCIEMIKSGTTTCNEMYSNSLGALKALDEAKIRCLYGRCLMNHDDGGQRRIDEFLNAYNLYKNKPLINFAVNPHSLYTCSKDYLKYASDLALKYNMSVHIHFCENENEVQGIKDNYNMSPVDALESLGFLRNKLILAHSTFVDDSSKFKGKDVSFVHNPVSNLNLGCGIMDILKHKDNVNICLGTDGQGSGNNMNLFYHMSFVDFLQKGINKNPSVFSSYETLKMATVNGAKALGLNNIGSIEIGKNADIIIVSLNDEFTFPHTDIITDLVHNTSPSNIKYTIINGEVLLDNGKLTLDIDINKLMSKLQEIIDKDFNI